MSNGGSISSIESRRRWKKKNPEAHKRHLDNQTKKRREQIENGTMRTKCADELKKETCDIIKKHHDDMKEDPESLSTEFIQDMIGRKCD